jgi:hypothetical protein
MLIEQGVEIDGFAFTWRVCLRSQPDLKGEAKLVKDAQEQAKLCRCFAGLEFVDPFAGDSGAPGQVRLIHSEVLAAAAYGCRQVPNGANGHCDLL